jgi:hypothetical protein
VRVAAADVAAVDGTGGVKGLRLTDGSRRSAAVIGLALPGAPAFELAEQAGAETRHGPDGYSVVTDADGRAGDGLFAVGECTGAPFDPAARARRAREVAAAVVASLR